MYVVFRINGQDVVGGDIEYHELGTVGTGTIILGVVIANTDILQLNAGDQVEVYFYSTVPGSIIGTAATRFAGYRVTSSTV